MHVVGRLTPHADRQRLGAAPQPLAHRPAQGQRMAHWVRGANPLAPSSNPPPPPPSTTRPAPHSRLPTGPIQKPAPPGSTHVGNRRAAPPQGTDETAAIVPRTATVLSSEALSLSHGYAHTCRPESAERAIPRMLRTVIMIPAVMDSQHERSHGSWMGDNRPASAGRAAGRQSAAGRSRNSCGPLHPSSPFCPG